MDRRSFLQTCSAFTGLSALALSGCTRRVAAAGSTAAPTLPFYDAVGPIPPIRADLDRIFRITVCLRPFRAVGPRMEAERVGDQLVVHNYGHGGSGWSLSWGAAEATVRTALTAAPTTRDVAVIGCGALGLTAALTAQRAGLAVTIYAKERPPFVRSARATGSWTPDSRIALVGSAPPAFAAQWESMARASFAMYQSFLGMPGNPIEWTERYSLKDLEPGQTTAQLVAQLDTQRKAPPTSQPPAHTEGRHEFARYESSLADLTPGSQTLPDGSHPFHGMAVRRTTRSPSTSPTTPASSSTTSSSRAARSRPASFTLRERLPPFPSASSSTALAMALASSGPTSPSSPSAARSPGSSRRRASTTAFTTSSLTSSAAATASSSSPAPRARKLAGTTPTNSPTAPKPRPASANSSSSIAA